MKIKYTNSYHIHPDNNIIVIWCAKAACSTVNYMFFEHEGLLEEALRYNGWIHNYRRFYQNRNKQLRYKYIRIIDYSRYIQFCVNPYRRAVSSYLHAMKGKYIGSANKNISFLTFLKRILSGVISDNPHHSKQTFFKNNYNNIYVVKMEYLETELPILNNKFNLHYKIYKNQNIKPKSDTINYFIGDQPWIFRINKIPNNYTYFYNDTIKELVEQIYGEDIKNLGYTWQMFVDYENKNCE